MKGQSFKCPSYKDCNSITCEHKGLHEKIATCSIICKWADCICASDVTEYTRSILTDVLKGSITVEDALDAIVTALGDAPSLTAPNSVKG
jgi:hypothetical protein